MSTTSRKRRKGPNESRVHSPRRCGSMHTQQRIKQKHTKYIPYNLIPHLRRTSLFYRQLAVLLVRREPAISRSSAPYKEQKARSFTPPPKRWTAKTTRSVGAVCVDRYRPCGTRQTGSSKRGRGKRSTGRLPMLYALTVFSRPVLLAVNDHATRGKHSSNLVPGRIVVAVVRYVMTISVAVGDHQPLFFFVVSRAFAQLFVLPSTATLSPCYGATHRAQRTHCRKNI